MRFLADMGISPRTVAYLRDLGHEAVHLHEDGLDRLADPTILDKALSEGRILLTHDLDFTDLLAASGANLPSVIIFRLQDMRPGQVNRLLGQIIEQHADALIAGAVCSVGERRIRVRLLPVR